MFFIVCISRPNIFEAKSADTKQSKVWKQVSVWFEEDKQSSSAKSVQHSMVKRFRRSPPWIADISVYIQNVQYAHAERFFSPRDLRVSITNSRGGRASFSRVACCCCCCCCCLGENLEFRSWPRCSPPRSRERPARTPAPIRRVPLDAGYPLAEGAIPFDRSRIYLWRFTRVNRNGWFTVDRRHSCDPHLPSIAH